jgi:hypothetical protein
MPANSAAKPAMRWQQAIGLIDRRRPAGVGLLQRIAGRRHVPPDPVLLAVLAIERLGPAAVRAAATGVEVCVAVPDEVTATVFRAALGETARHRRTDRLVRIVVD